MGGRGWWHLSVGTRRRDRRGRERLEQLHGPGPFPYLSPLPRPQQPGAPRVGGVSQPSQLTRRDTEPHLPLDSALPAAPDLRMPL